LIPETQQHYQQLKTWDPQGISLATNLAAAYRDPALWNNAADVLAIDPYVLYGAEPPQGYPHFVIGDFTARLRAAAPADRPIWMVLQFFKFTSNSRMPTEGELRAQAVMSVVEGAQGIFWWDIGVNGLLQLDATTVATYMGYLKTLTTELAGLEPVLLAPSADSALVGNTTRFADPVAGQIAQLQHNIAVEILYSRIQADQAEIAALQAGDTSKSPMLAGASNVRTRTKVVNGVGYVFAYNYTNLQQPVTFTWKSSLTGVTESKSGQSLPVSGASWSDTFGPYEARIYIVHGGTGPSLATPRDFDGNGKADVLWRDTAGNVAVWLMNGPAVASNTFITNVPMAWTPVGNGSKDFGDFNGDGKTDILWRDTSGNVALWLMNGATIASNIFVANVPTAWTPVRIGDFDGDGKADILWRDTAGNVSMWLMNGGTIVANKFITNVPTAWTPVAAGDFNGDGKADILWRDTSGNVAIWLMNGSTITGNSFLMNVPTTWTAVGVGDFNGDGKADILWRDTSGNLALWLMNGATIASNVSLGQISTVWTPVRVGDFNGDGKADILWRDSAGNTAVWLMNGATVLSNTFITNVGTSWSTQ